MLVLQTPLLVEFLHFVQRERVEKSAQFLSNYAHLLLNPLLIARDQTMLSLHQEVAALSSAYIENICYEILGEDWTQFTDMMIAYVEYLKELNIQAVIMAVEEVAAPRWCEGLSTFMG